MSEKKIIVYSVANVIGAALTNEMPNKMQVSGIGVYAIGEILYVLIVKRKLFKYQNAAFHAVFQGFGDLLIHDNPLIALIDAAIAGIVSLNPIYDFFLKNE